MKEHPKYPITDWKYEVANEDTILGYLEWLQHKLECDTDKKEDEVPPTDISP